MLTKQHAGIYFKTDSPTSKIPSLHAVFVFPTVE